MKLKKMVTLAATLVAGFALAACQTTTESQLEKIKEKGTLVVATSPDYAPFEFQTLVDGENKIVGSDILLAEKLAEELGVTLEISPMSFDNVLNSVQNGKADLAIAGLSVSPEREEIFDFSDPYYQVGNVLLVQKGHVDTYDSVKSLDKADLAVQKGTTQETYAKDSLSNANIVSLTMMGEAVNQLKNGKVKAILLDSAVAEGYISQNPDLGIAKLSFKAEKENAKAIAMKKDSGDLKTEINKIVAEIVESGEYNTYLEEAATYTAVE
ncbi:transporter substrate-binding domain-containing protein [Streptococcus cameli]